MDGSLRGLISQNVIPVDTRFALDNFEYITTEMNNEKIADIYKMLGPFDFNAWEPEQDQNPVPEGSDDVIENPREMNLFWDTRKSGAMFRGELMSETKRPDGRGFKVHNGKSVYEGYFVDGMC